MLDLYLELWRICGPRRRLGILGYPRAPAMLALSARLGWALRRVWYAVVKLVCIRFLFLYHYFQRV